MMKKHRVRINVTDSRDQKQRVLDAADMRLPARLIRWLFGEYSTVYLLKPGQTIDSVEVHEVEPDKAD